MNNAIIDDMNIITNKLKFNLVLIDDMYINQLTYHDDNKSKVNIKLIKSKHLTNIVDHVKNTKYSDFLIIDKL
jgi:hypothetical protein